MATTASSATGTRLATTASAPARWSAAASPSSSSPALTAAVPTSQAASTTSRGARRSFSRSNTVSIPSASRRLENIGLSTRNVPWQARWATSAPSSAASTASTRAASPSKTLAAG